MHRFLNLISSFYYQLFVPTLRNYSCLRFLVGVGYPNTDLFMYGRKQNIKYFFFYITFLCSVICLGFFHVYAKFHKNPSLRKGNICNVSIISEQPLYISSG